MRLWLITILAALPVACAGGPIIDEHRIAPPVAATSGDVLQSTVPAVDHHEHLMGPAITRLASGPALLRPVTVPAEFERLLSEREAAAKDAPRLARLYTDDAALLTEERSGWISGRDKVARYLVDRFGRPYSLTPVYFSRNGNSAQIAGYYTRGEEPSRQDIGYFHLALSRGSGGRWLIAAELPRFPIQQPMAVRTADKLIEELDRAGIHRAAVLSTGFWADGPIIPVDNPYPHVAAENDWTAAQVERFPDRLVAFCSFNPVADHALRELERCAASRRFRGLKFSFAMSSVDLKNADHVRRVRAVFAAANRHGLAIVAHTRGGEDYGAEHAEILLRDVLPAAPDVVIQIAHLWGGEAYSAEALNAFAQAVADGRPGTRNLHFDIAEILAEISQTSSPGTQLELAAAIRRIGVERILFGSDGQDARTSWRTLVGFLPLNEDELRTIAGNVAPYLR